MHITLLWLTPTSTFFIFFPCTLFFFFSLLNYIEKFENKTSQLYKHMAVIPICTIFNFFFVKWENHWYRSYWDNIHTTLTSLRYRYLHEHKFSSDQPTHRKKNHMMKKKFSKNGWSKSHDLDNMHQS